jgi:GNAT superfamily N-acetyltransferase
MKLVVRRAAREDLAAILAFYAEDELHGARERALDASQRMKLAEEAWAEIATDPREMSCVAELDGRVVGTFQMTFLRYLTYGGARVALVEAVHVDARERSRGIGEAMMRHAIDEARRRGCHRVQLTSNKVRTRAHRFYERLGFVSSHEGFKLVL